MTGALGQCQLASKESRRLSVYGIKDNWLAFNALEKMSSETAITFTCFRIVNTIGHNKEVKAKLQMKSFSETFSITDT